MSSPLPFGGEALLSDLERSTARLSGLNPDDFAIVHNALAERTLTIDRLVAWIAACQPPLDPDPELTARIEKTLATGAHLAVRLALVRADVRTQIAEMERARRLLDALPKAAAPPHAPVLDCRG